MSKSKLNHLLQKVIIRKQIPSKSNDPYKQEKGDNCFHFILEPTDKKS
jgi:hypothetical protein